MLPIVASATESCKIQRPEISLARQAGDFALIQSGLNERDSKGKRSPQSVAAADPEKLFDRKAIDDWLVSALPRGNKRLKNIFPSDNKMKYCSGTGCPFKIPFEFTADEIKVAEKAMDSGRRKENCMADTIRCEQIALKYGVTQMDQIVKERRLLKMDRDEVKNFSVGSTDSTDSNISWMNEFETGKQLVRDCVDQATNGTSFLVILAQNGLVKHHRIIAPGRIDLGLQPHFFTRIEDEAGAVYRFDLYHSKRDAFGLLPGIIKIR